MGGAKRWCPEGGVCETARHCVKSKPPMVLFTVVLFVFAFAFVGLLFYVDWLDLSEPESQKWEAFVDKLDDLRFCVEDFTEPVEYVPSVNEQNFSVSLSVLIKPTWEFVTKNVSQAQAVLNASDLGFPDTNTGVAVFVSLSFAMSPETMGCDKATGFCKETTLSVCATFFNLTSYFPDHPQFPKTCSQGSAGAALPRVHMEARSYCNGFPSLKLTSSPTTSSSGAPAWNMRPMSSGASLTELSSLHLLYTSYFIFFMAFSVLVYSAFKASRAAATMDKGHLVPPLGSAGGGKGASF